METEFNPEFITRMLPRLEWPTIIQGATAVSLPIEMLLEHRLCLHVFLLTFCHDFNRNVSTSIQFDHLFKIIVFLRIFDSFHRSA